MRWVQIISRKGQQEKIFREGARRSGVQNARKSGAKREVVEMNLAREARGSWKGTTSVVP